MREDKVKLTPATKSQKEFMNLSDETLKAATSFAMFWGKGNDDFVLWEILSDTDYITDNNFKPPDTANVIDPKFDFTMDDFAQKFFQHVFPSTVGHAKILTSTCLTNVLLILRLYKMIKLFFMILMILTLTGKLKTAIFC